MLYGVVIKEDDGCNQGYACEPHLPVASDAVEENLSQIALAAKLRENGPGGATPTKLEVDNVGSIDHDAHDVDDPKYYLHNALIAHGVAALQGGKLQHHAHHVKVAQGAQVESQASHHHCHHVAQGHVGEVPDVHRIKHPSHNHVDGHHEHEIHCHYKARLFNELFFIWN